MKYTDEDRDQAMDVLAAIAHAEDGENWQGPDNQTRANWAELPMRLFAKITGLDWGDDDDLVGSDRSCVAGDLMADMFHYLRLHPDLGTPEDRVDNAFMHFEEELQEEEEDEIGDDPWTKEHREHATAQGWGVFAIDSDDEFPMIQRLDEAGVFNSDADAYAYVIDMAHKGDQTAILALQLCPPF